MIEEINLTAYLDNIELVVVGSESDRNARPLDYAWVLSVRSNVSPTKYILSFGSVGHILSRMEKDICCLLVTYAAKTEKQILIIE